MGFFQSLGQRCLALVEKIFEDFDVDQELHVLA